MLSPYLDGDANIVQDIAAGVGGIGAAGIRDLTVAQFVSRLGSSLGDSALAESLLAAVQNAGVADRTVGAIIDTDAK